MTWTPKKIRTLRRCLDWSRSDMARRMNCSVDQISDWETGEDFPSFEQTRLLELLDRQKETIASSVKSTPQIEQQLNEEGFDQRAIDEFEH